MWPAGVRVGRPATVQVAGAAGIPQSDVASVVVSMSGKGESGGSGTLTVYASDDTKPNTTALSYRPTSYGASTSLIKVGADGKIKVTNNGSSGVRVYLDAHGYTLSTAGSTAGSTYVGLNPARIGNGVTIPAQGFIEFPTLGQGGVPQSGVESVAINLTSLGSGTGTIRVYPLGDMWPTDATIDYPSGSYQQNFMIAKLGTNGRLNLHNFGWQPVTVWVDVAGYTTKSADVPPGAVVKALKPARLLENIGLPANSTHTIDPLGLNGVPQTGASALALSITARSSSGTGTVSAYPTGISNPGVNTVAYDSTTTMTGSTWVRVGHDGKVVLRNNGTVDTTVSVDVTGYLKDSPPETAGSLTASPAASGEEDVVASTTPELSAKATDPDGGTLDYTYQVALDSDRSTAIATGTAKNVPSGEEATWTVPAGQLGNPGAYAFRVRADDANHTGEWTDWKRLSIDAPHVPSALTTSLVDTPNPVLSGVVSRASDRQLTGRFHLYDANDQPIGPTPLGEGTVQAGQRVALMIPDGLVQAGNTYKWRMEACDGDACGPRSGLVPFTVQSPPAAPATQSLTLGSDKLTLATAKVGETACNGGACPLTPGTAVVVGGSGDDETLTQLKIDASGLPAGARITSAQLSLGAPTCTGTCPAGAELPAYEAEAALPENPTGADALANLPETAIAEPDLAAPVIDVTGAVAGADDGDQGIFLRLPDGPSVSYPAGAAMKVDLQYVPAGPPSQVETVTARAGDGGLLASYSSTDGTVTLRATVDGSTTQDDDETDPKVSEFRDVVDYVFNVGTSGVGLTHLRNADGVDAAVGNATDINAMPTGETSPAEDMPVIPTDENGFPTGESAPGAATNFSVQPLAAASRAGFNQTGAARWAYDHVFSEKADYKGSDCANFISKALNRGGGLGQVKSHQGGNTNNVNNWYAVRKVRKYWPDSYTTTRSWRLVIDQYKHLVARKRMNPNGWRRTHDDVRVGDLVFWREKSKSYWTHVTIVTEVRGHGARRDVLTTSHTSTYRNESVFAEKRVKNWVAGFIPVLD